MEFSVAECDVTIGYLGIQFNLTEFVVLGCDLVLSNLESQNRIWCIIDKLMDQNSVGQPKNQKANFGEDQRNIL